MQKAIAYKNYIVNVDFVNKNNPRAIVENSSKNINVVKGVLYSVYKTVTHKGMLGVNSAFEYDGNLMIANQGGLFVYRGNMGDYLMNIAFTAPSYLYCAKQKTMLISEPGVGTYGYSDSLRKYFDFGFDTMALCNERAVGAKNNVLYFTERGSAAKWYGTLELPGSVVAVVEYGNDLLAIGEEIFKIELADDAADSKVTSLCKGVGKVFPKTVISFGNKLIFLTDSGLYSFYKGKIERICKDIPFAAANSSAVAIYNDGYWIAFDRTDGERVLLCLSNNGTQYIYNVNATNLVSIENKVSMIIDGEIKKFSKFLAAELTWISKNYDFGNRFVRKHFRSLTVVGEGEFDVHLVTERERRIYHFQSGAHKIRLNGYFAQVSVEIHATTHISVEKLALEARSYGGEVAHGYDK